jgi:hypothetical protein
MAFKWGVRSERGNVPDSLQLILVLEFQGLIGLNHGSSSHKEDNPISVAIR